MLFPHGVYISCRSHSEFSHVLLFGMGCGLKSQQSCLNLLTTEFASISHHAQYGQHFPQETWLKRDVQSTHTNVVRVSISVTTSYCFLSRASQTMSNKSVWPSSVPSCVSAAKKRRKVLTETTVAMSLLSGLLTSREEKAMERIPSPNRKS